MQEVWKDVPDYEGLYQVSDLGNVKSLAKTWVCGRGNIIKKGDTILKPGIDSQGYFNVILCKNRKRSNKIVHRLVYESFNGKTDLQIDHIIEGNKLDNRLCNLQEVTNRQNSIKYHLNKRSKYVGVFFDKRYNKWSSRIQINGIRVYLGCFTTEYHAHQAYQKALNELQIKV